MITEPYLMYLYHQKKHLAENLNTILTFNTNIHINIMLLFTIELTSREELVELLNADNDLCKEVGEPLCADIYISITYKKKILRIFIFNKILNNNK